MPYLKTEVKCGPYIFTYKGFALRYLKKNPRVPNSKVTSEAQKLRNQYYARRRKIWLIATNFSKGDLWITLTYKKNKRPADMVGAKKDRTKFIRKIRDNCKKNNIAFIYMGMTEVGVRGGVHHHFIMSSRIDENNIFQSWKNYGFVKVGAIGDISEISFDESDEDAEQAQDDVIKLAKYFVKGDSDKSEKDYTQSKYLKQPKIHKKIIKAERWAGIPKPKKGYAIQSVYDGFHDFSGYPYQEYVMVRRC